jgi:hypothetical protein
MEEVMNTTQKVFLVFAALIFSFSAHAAPAAEKEWTFLLFLNGHNNLSSFGDMNLKDMEKSGSNDQVNLVVEWGKSNDDYTHRLLVQKSTNPSKVTSPIIMSQKDVDMGDYKNLVEFVRWGAANFPAKHYFVAIWNHGSGWHFQDMLKVNGQVQINDISYDDNTDNRITTEQLGQAMREIKTILGRNVDVYGSDACLMQMIEVATEMKDTVDYFVGSQHTEPGEGWPYETFVKKWTAQPTVSPAGLSVLLSKEYLKAYSSGGVYSRNDVTFSAFDMLKLAALNESTAQLVNHMKTFDKATLTKVKTAMNASQDFYYSDYKDYGDFLKRFEALPIAKDAKLIQQVKSDLKQAILTTDNSTSSFANATGLSIWMPSYASGYMERYSALEFNKTTAWADVLKAVTSP